MSFKKSMIYLIFVILVSFIVAMGVHVYRASHPAAVVPMDAAPVTPQ
jgi:hypothetical protein